MVVFGLYFIFMSILIVDAYNLFIRSYAAYPSISSVTGEQTGGIVGFIKSLQYIIDDIKPDKVFLVWEGGGSSRRRSLQGDYKRGRKAQKLNRFYDSDEIPDTIDNKFTQVVQLLNMLKSTSIRQIYVENCEADDVIAYMTRVKFHNDTITIVSTDKDYYQLLLTEKIRIYNPHKKIYITDKDVIAEYKIHPKNFALAKTLCGDSSDNIEGIKGVGYKTVIKYFPILMSSSDVILQDLFKYASAHIDEKVVYRNVISSNDKIQKNWKLIYLDTSSISFDQINKINYQVDKPPSEKNIREFIGLQCKFGIMNVDAHAFFDRIGKLK